MHPAGGRKRTSINQRSNRGDARGGRSKKHDLCRAERTIMSYLAAILLRHLAKAFQAAADEIEEETRKQDQAVNNIKTAELATHATYPDRFKI